MSTESHYHPETDDEPGGGSGGYSLSFYEEGSTDDDFLYHETKGDRSDVVPAVAPSAGTITTATFSNELGNDPSPQVVQIRVNGVLVQSFQTTGDTSVHTVNVPLVAGDRVSVYVGTEVTDRMVSPVVTLYTGA